MPNLEEAIRERAYHLWIADGQPEGQADIYWLNAQREILTTSVESSGSNAAAAAPTDTDWLRRNPPKRQGSPDREKTKPAPHSSMRASSRGPVTTTSSPAERVAPLLFVKRMRPIFWNAETVEIGLREVPALPRPFRGGAPQLPPVPRIAQRLGEVRRGQAVGYAGSDDAPRVSDFGSPDDRGDGGAAAARQDGLGDVIRLPTVAACAR